MKEVRWMFEYLDKNSDGRLSLKELYYLEHDEHEHCIKPFLDKCDFNRDIFLHPYEWCKCFDKSSEYLSSFHGPLSALFTHSALKIMHFIH